MKINTSAVFVSFFLVVITQFVFSSEKWTPIDENIDCITGSNIGMNILKNFKRAVVAKYVSGDDSTFGLSLNPDGKRIKEFNEVPKDDVSDFVDLLFDRTNLEIQFGKEKKDRTFNGEKLNWNQGIELSDNHGYVRVYFTQDGRYCMFYTSSGIKSTVWICSDKLASAASVLLGKLQANKEAKNEE